MTNPRFILVSANERNAGDAMSALAVRALLHEHAAQVRVVFCDRPWQPGLAGAFAALEPGEVVIIGPGGLLMDYFDPVWEALGALPDHVGLVMWGTGVCDAPGRDSLPRRDAVLARLGGARVVSVRDELTADFLTPDVAARVDGCPTLALADRLPTRTQPSSLLMVRHPQLVTGDQWRALAQAASRALPGLPIRQTDNLIDGPPRVPAEYASARCVVSSRLHGCIFAVGMGIPVVAVSADRKIDSFMAAAGLSGWVVAPDDTEGLRARLRDIVSQPSARDYVERMSRRQREVAAAVVQASL